MSDFDVNIITPSDTSNGSVIAIEPVVGVKQYRLCYMSDGLQITGFLTMPEAATQKLPVLIVNHGGCDDWSKIGGRFCFGLDFLASLSIKGPYVVLASQYRGIDGSQGEDEWCGKDVDDVLNLLPLAERIPMADTSKLMMLGYSRGGAMTYAAIKAGMPLKAAVVVSGPTDLIQEYHERDEDMNAVFRAHLGGTPDSAPDAYKARSAFYWPEKINVPTLILHGDADDRVSVTEAQKLSTKLDELGKPHKLVVVEGGNHCLSNRLGATQLILEWLAEHAANH